MSKTVPGFSLNSFISPAASAGDWYRNINYEDTKKIIKEKMVSSAENFVAIGYYLNHMSEKKQYLEGGYESIWECSEKEFGFSKGRTSRCINICRAYSVGGDSPFLDERFKGFNTSQLQEMLSIKDEYLIEQITPDMSVKKIREAKAVDGKLTDDVPLDGQMQIATIEGDFRIFDPATDNEDDLAVKQESLPLREILDEDDSDFLEEKQESDLKEPTDEEIRDFYKKFVKGQYDCNRDDLKNKLREAMGKTHHYHGGSSGSFQCSPRGVSINSSQEITWTKLVKRINELIPEEEPKNTASAEPAKTVQDTVEQGHEIKQLPCNEENIEEAIESIFEACANVSFPQSTMDALVEQFQSKKVENYISPQLVFNKILPFKNDIVNVSYQCGYLIQYIHTNESLKIPIYSFWQAFEKHYSWMWKEETKDNILVPDMNEFGKNLAIGKDKSSLPDSNVVIINFSGCYGEFCRELTEREIEIFKKGVLAERERIWDKLADILNEDAKKWILQLNE